MITCPRSERLVALLHDSELDSPLRREIASHVAGCVVCTRTLAALERVQELVVQAISEQVEESDFSTFWEGVASKLDQQAPSSWRLWLQVWREKLRLTWAPGAPLWAATAATLLVTTLFISHAPPSKKNVPIPHETPVLAANDQAQIESLSASETVFLWNEPESNATVIWVSDDNDGGMP